MPLKIWPSSLTFVKLYWIPTHATIGLFEVHDTSGSNGCWINTFLTLNLIIGTHYVKDKGNNFLHMTRALILNCLWGPNMVSYWSTLQKPYVCWLYLLISYTNELKIVKCTLYWTLKILQIYKMKKLCNFGKLFPCVNPNFVPPR